MGTVVRKASCISGLHEDKTPSMAIYDNGSAYCFSCCSHFANIQAPVAEVKKEPENLTEKFIYINSLPWVDHRGLKFMHDSRGYFITWPGQEYYKYRLWAPRADEPKYIGAKGIKKPWYVLRAYQKTKTCVITEGEINALSIASAFDDTTTSSNCRPDILSPGGASNFFDGEMKSRVEVFKNYATLLVLVDKDKAGVEGVINFHKLAKPYCSDIRIKLMDKGNDANDILCGLSGKERLKEIILGM